MLKKDSELIEKYKTGKLDYNEMQAFLRRRKSFIEKSMPLDESWFPDKNPVTHSENGSRET